MTDIKKEIENDLFKEQSKHFGELVIKARENKNVRISCLIEASKIKNSGIFFDNSDLLNYNDLLNDEVYSHVIRRLDEIIKKIRFHIHKKEYDKAKVFLKDMRILGDFIKDKNLKFNFEFYNKIIVFFDKKETKTKKLFPFFK